MSPTARKERIENRTAVFVFAAVAAFLALFTALWGFGARNRAYLAFSAAPTAELTTAAQAASININAASAEELMKLPGIGEKKAAAIVAYRESHGAFSAIEEIKNVPGVGDGIFERIKGYITVEDKKDPKN